MQSGLFVHTLAYGWCQQVIYPYLQYSLQHIFTVHNLRPVRFISSQPTVESIKYPDIKTNPLLAVYFLLLLFFPSAPPRIPLVNTEMQGGLERKLNEYKDQIGPEYEAKKREAEARDPDERFSEEGSSKEKRWWKLSKEELAKYQLQADLELNAIDTATEYYRKSIDGILRARQGGSLGPARRILDTWYGPFRDELNNAIRKMAVRSTSHTLVANLKLLSSDKLPVITLHQTMGMLLANPDGVPFMQLAFAVGRAVQAEINFERMKAEDKQAFRALLKSKSGITVTLVNMKAKYTLKKHDWDSKTIVQVINYCLVTWNHPNVNLFSLVHFC